MPPLNVRVRLPGAKEPEEVSVQSELLVAGAISVIAKQLGAGNLTGAKLVVAPTGRKNGVIADSSSRLSELLFNPEEVCFIPVNFNIIFFFWTLVTFFFIYLLFVF